MNNFTRFVESKMISDKVCEPANISRGICVSSAIKSLGCCQLVDFLDVFLIADFYSMWPA